MASSSCSEQRSISEKAPPAGRRPGIRARFPEIRRLQESLRTRYALVSRDVPVAGRRLSLFMVQDPYALLDAIEPAAFAVDERLPYWAELWPSSIVLARYCLGGNVRPGERVLDLGCGIGLAGIAAAEAGAAVTMADYEEDALHFARLNAACSLPRAVVKSRCDFRLLDWRSPCAEDQYDVIVGGDIVYERRSVAPVLDFIGRALARNGRAIIADPGRSTGEEFLAAAVRRGLAVESERTKVFWNDRQCTITRSVLRRSEAAA